MLVEDERRHAGQNDIFKVTSCTLNHESNTEIPPKRLFSIIQSIIFSQFHLLKAQLTNLKNILSYGVCVVCILTLQVVNVCEYILRNTFLRFFFKWTTILFLYVFHSFIHYINRILDTVNTSYCVTCFFSYYSCDLFFSFFSLGTFNFLLHAIS